MPVAGFTVMSLMVMFSAVVPSPPAMVAAMSATLPGFALAPASFVSMAMTLCEVGSATSSSQSLPKLMELMLFSFKPPL